MIAANSPPTSITAQDAVTLAVVLAVLVAACHSTLLHLAEMILCIGFLCTVCLAFDAVCTVTFFNRLRPALISGLILIMVCSLGSN